MARLNRIWRSETISFTSKSKLYKYLVTAPQSSSTAVRYGPCLLYLKKKKDAGFRDEVPGETSPRTRPPTGCGVRSTSLWVHRNLSWQLSRDGTSHGWGMSCAKTVSPQPPTLQVTFEEGRHRGRLEEVQDGQRQRVDIPVHAKPARDGLPKRETGRESLLKGP